MCIRDGLETGIAVDGVFASNDMAVLGAVEASQASGIKVPGDIAIVGFSNWQFSEMLNLSSVGQPGYEMGREAVKLIFQEINAEEETKSQIRILDTELIARGSSVRK